MGLFDQQPTGEMDPLTVALMSMGFNLMSPKQYKTNAMGELGQAGMFGLNAMQQAQQQNLLGRKEGAQTKLLDLQAQAAQQALEREKARAAALQGVFAQGQQPAQVGQNFAGANPNYTPPPQAGGAPSTASDPRAAMRSMYYKTAQMLAQQGFGDDAQKFFDMAVKLEDEFNPTAQTLMVDGKPVPTMLSKQGNVKPLAGYGAKPDFQKVDLGNQVGFMDPLTGTRGPFMATGIAPGERARLAFEGALPGGGPAGGAPASSGAGASAPSMPSGGAPAMPAGNPGLSPKARQDLALSTQQGLAKGGVDYKNALDQTVQVGNDLMMRIGESREALKSFTPGMGAESRMQVARAADALGMPDALVKRINAGDLAAKQEFTKLAAQQAMESLKQAMGGSGRITQAEFKVFQANNPNIELQPDAIEKIFAFAQRVHSRNTAEQGALTDYLGKGGSISEWPSKWTQQTGAGIARAGGPKIGSVEDGYVYIGGPAGARESWKRQ